MAKISPMQATPRAPSKLGRDMGDTDNMPEIPKEKLYKYQHRKPVRLKKGAK